MKPIEDMEYFLPAERIVKVLTKKTQSTNPLFFRVLVAYYFAKVASMMRTNIDTPDRGIIPVNLFALNLAPSGMGKGLSTNILEDQVLAKFKHKFLNETFLDAADDHMLHLTIARVKKSKQDPDVALIQTKKEFEQAGAMVFSFDSGTPAAIKQIRHKLLMANAGSICFEMDEVGSNFANNIDVMNTFIELYDVGKIKTKLVKNTLENSRNEEIDGRTPTNMMLFGTPSKLLDGGKLEQEFFSMLETGYARRLLFGYSTNSAKKVDMTPTEMYDMLTDTTSDLDIETLANKLESLAEPAHFNVNLTMTKDVSLELIDYQLKCGQQAELMKEHEEVKKAELIHRYYRVLKLAGAYAFIDSSFEITSVHLEAAIKLVEDSGAAFHKILTRDKPYVKLAKYIADVNKDLTQVDLVEDLPFYKGSEASRREMMNLAIAYGYKHSIIIKKTFSEGIEFLRGETLEPTDLNAIKFSYSQHLADGYEPAKLPFDELHGLTTQSGYHYAAHHFRDKHRSGDKAIPGFNAVILDVDKGISLETAKLLLKDYMYLISTTKRHRVDGHGDRFRIIMPLSHTLYMNAKEYSEFMKNVYDWLPFEEPTDEATSDIARKWETFPGDHVYNLDGALLDAMLFIPQTKKSDDQRALNKDIGSLNNLERWFLNNTGYEGDRNKMLHRYARALVDNNYTIEQIRNALLSFNEKLPNKMNPEEISTTVMITVTKEITKRELTRENENSH